MFKMNHIKQEEADPTKPGGEGSGDPPAPAPAWYDGFKDPAAKEWLAAYKGAYPDPESVAVKALNLEKFITADKAGRGVVVPKEDATPEEWKSFYKKVGGVPDTPDGYKIPENLLQDPMAKSFREHAHAAGIPPKFVEGVFGWFAETMKAQHDQQLLAFDAESEKDVNDLKNEWKGIEYDKNIELGRRAAKMFVPHSNAQELKDFIDRMEGAVGTKNTFKLWAAIGAGLGEHGFVQGNTSGDGGGMTREAAKIRIDQLKRDPEWAAKFAGGGSDQKLEWDRLHKIAFGGQ